MGLKAIINEIADQADAFLEGVAKRDEARAAISEQITILHPSLSGPDRAKVIEGVMSLLDQEGFFELRSDGDEADKLEAEEE